MSKTGIYSIDNIVNGRMYVGSAVNLKRRKGEHLRALKAGTHPNVMLQRAWLKYGAEALAFNVLEYVEDRAKLIEREQYWIDKLEAFGKGYNARPRADSSLGTKLSAETKAKISAAASARKVRPKFSAETRAKLSAIKLGKKMSLEARAIMSIAAKAREERKRSAIRLS